MSKRKKKQEFPNTHPEETAFRRSDGYYFLGNKLQPFSFVRQSALSALLGVMGTTPLVELAAGMWILHQDEKTAQAARRNPEGFVSVVDDFADQHGITMTGRALQAATEVYEAICEDLRNSAAVPVTGENQPSEKDPAYDPN